MVPPGLVLLGLEHDLPSLPDTEIVLYRAPGTLSRAAEILAEHIIHSLETAATAPALASPAGDGI